MCQKLLKGNTSLLATSFLCSAGATHHAERTADMLNISQQAYAHYENNKRNPNINILMKLAEIYDVSLDRLSGRYENTKNNENKEFKKKI